MSIHSIKPYELESALRIIRNSFATVADEFHLTKENCPGHTTFITLEKLKIKYDSGDRMYMYTLDSVPVGCFSLKQLDYETWELDHLAVLPEYRHCGIGKELLEFAEKTIQVQNGKLLKIGIMEENVKPKQWYMQNGFLSTGTKRFAHLPFTVGFMEKRFKQ